MLASVVFPLPGGPDRIIEERASFSIALYKRESLLSNHLITESDAEMDSRATAAVRSALDRAKVCKKPVAKYDTVTKRAYVEYADGEKKYVN